jgi:hypothetical protein
MEFDIKNIFRKAFGYEPPADFSIQKSTGRKEYSDLGQPYYKEDALGREFFLPVELDGYLVPFAVISVTEKKTFVETPLPERGGSVLELISIDNYAINIKGIVLQESFPEGDMRDVHNIFLKNKSLSLRSVITDIFLTGDFEHKVAIKSIKWAATSGVEHAKPFEIECQSDMIFVLDVGELVGPVNVGI